MNKLISLIGIIITCFVTGYFISTNIIQIIIGLVPSQVQLVALNPSDGFLVLFWGIIVGIIPPLIFLMSVWLWKNYNEILYDKEKSFLTKMIPTSIILFLSGLVFGIYLYLIIILPYFIEINTSLGLTNIWSLSNVIISSITIGLSLGLSFQLPIFLRFAIKLGLIKTSFLKKQRFIIIAGILIVSAFITPPDVVSQVMVGLPLYLLFELSMIGVNINE